MTFIVRSTLAYDFEQLLFCPHETECHSSVSSLTYCDQIAFPLHYLD